MQGITLLGLWVLLGDFLCWWWPNLPQKVYLYHYLVPYHLMFSKIGEFGLLIQFMLPKKNGELDNLYSPLLSSSWGSLNFGLHSLSKTSPFRFMFSKISNVELQKKHNSKSRDTSGNAITAYWKITKMSSVAIVTTGISLLWIWKNCVILCARKYCLNHWLVFFNL